MTVLVPALKDLDLDAITALDVFLAAGEHDARSEYVERFWLPVIGPSSLLMLRELWRRLCAGEQSARLGDLSHAIGLGSGRSLGRTLSRLAAFGLVRVDVAGVISVRCSVPKVSARAVSQFPDSLRLAHEAF